ncbi:MAG: ISAzo13 family transposase [Boseongicola sp. SB0662_bin_57]|nr:ISAzo13 family transposase [Boseongicola sp. SB0662_bin_57]
MGSKGRNGSRRRRIRCRGGPQDGGGSPASGPRRAVPAHRPQGEGLPEAWPAGHLGRHEEEGACRPCHNGGREWRPKGTPEKVNVHDFPDPELGKAIPCGVYDMTADKGWVSVGIDHDTASFAVESVRRWWRSMGRPLYRDAGRLLITADGGGSNSSRNRLWKFELQRLADELGLKISVSHFPPGTSKWNRIEHRMFCHITRNWRGRPLVSCQVIVALIAATTTRTGLKIRSGIDDNEHPLGVKVSDEQMKALNIRRDGFHGEWNYTLMNR